MFLRINFLILFLTIVFFQPPPGWAQVVPPDRVENWLNRNYEKLWEPRYKTVSSPYKNLTLLLDRFDGRVWLIEVEESGFPIPVKIIIFPHPDSQENVNVYKAPNYDIIYAAGDSDYVYLINLREGTMWFLLPIEEELVWFPVVGYGRYQEVIDNSTEQLSE